MSGAIVTDLELTVDGHRLTGLVAETERPVAARRLRAGVGMVHGLPHRDPERSDDATYGDLAARIAADTGAVVAAVTLRGCGTSGGDFSLAGWRRDMGATIDHLIRDRSCDVVFLIGAATGGSVAVTVAGEDPRVRGVATLAARADFDDWASHPRRFLEHCRTIGVVRSPDFPASLDTWAKELRAVRPLDGARRLGNRSLLLIHGGADRLVPVTDQRRLADAHGAAQVRVMPSAGHGLRHDPRVVAILLGWLDRQVVAADDL